MIHCFKCGKIGHKQDTCWTQKTLSVKRCTICKKSNHQTYQCKFRKQNVMKCSICHKSNHTAINCQFKLRRAVSEEKSMSTNYSEKVYISPKNIFYNKGTQTDGTCFCKKDYNSEDEINTELENMEMEDECDSEQKIPRPKFISERKF